MKILRIILTPEKIENIVEDVYYIQTQLQNEAASLNKFFKENINILKGKYTHIQILKAGIETVDNFLELLLPYSDKKGVLIPILQYNELDEEGKEQFVVFMNTTVWKQGYTEEYGEMDLALANLQLDFTLYGCLIPLEIIEKYPFKEKFEYLFYQFEWLNRIMFFGESAPGIPKVLLKGIFDYRMKDVPNDKKVKLFYAAQKLFSNVEDIDITDDVLPK